MNIWNIPVHIVHWQSSLFFILHCQLNNRHSFSCHSNRCHQKERRERADETHTHTHIRLHNWKFTTLWTFHIYYFFASHCIIHAKRITLCSSCIHFIFTFLSRHSESPSVPYKAEKVVFKKLLSFMALLCFAQSWKMSYVFVYMLQLI